MNSHNFVLLHGAWHGAWCWEHVAMNLTALGHTVTTPTQRGLGERSDELTMAITLTDFVEDVVEHLNQTDVRDAVLVGHSFGGNGISGAADVVPQRIRKLVYFDALILENGQAPFDRLPRDLVAQRVQLAQQTSGGISLPPPPPESFGVFDDKDAQWLENNLTPHPFGTYQSPLKLQHPVANGIDAHYVVCNKPIYEPLADVREWVRKAGWPVHELAAGHDAMVTEPALTTELLLKIAAC